MRMLLHVAALSAHGVRCWFTLSDWTLRAYVCYSKVGQQWQGYVNRTIANNETGEVKNGCKSLIIIVRIIIIRIIIIRSLVCRSYIFQTEKAAKSATLDHWWINLLNQTQYFDDTLVLCWTNCKLKILGCRYCFTGMSRWTRHIHKPDFAVRWTRTR